MELSDDILQEVFSYINYSNILYEIDSINNKLSNLFYAEKINNVFYRNDVEQLVFRKKKIFKKCCNKLIVYHRFASINHAFKSKLPPKLMLNVEDKKLLISYYK